MSILALLVATSLCASGVLAQTTEVDFEWGGLFATPDDTYTWISQKTDPADGGDAAYVDETMRLVVLVAADGEEATLTGLEATAKTALSLDTCPSVATNSTLTVDNNVCNLVVFDQDMYQTMFRIDTSSNTHIAIFAQHVPTEFEKDTHYLKDQLGEDIEPLAEVPETVVTVPDKPWGKVIGSTILVCLVTLVGVILVTPAFSPLRTQYTDEFEAVSSAFAGGAILSTAFYLVLYESTHYVNTYNSGTDEVPATWRWGTAVMGGFALPLFTEAFRKAIMGGSAEVSPSDPEKGDGPAYSPSDRYRVIAGVLIGDFMHNVVDGILIGVAFHLCNDSKGWTVVGATIGHEIAQELGDFILLTGPGVDLSTPMALALNFLSGISVIIGGIVILDTDVSNKAQGIIMAIGGGTYIAIGAAECMPRVFQKAKTAKAMWMSVLAFVVGVVAIALVLLDHQHCIPEGGDGHAH